MENKVLASVLERFCNPFYYLLRLQKRVQSKSHPNDERTRAAPETHSSTQAVARTGKPPQQKHPPHQRTQKRYNDEVQNEIIVSLD